MAIIKTIYKGSLSTSTDYPLSANPILTQGSPFGPTDLLTASLGSCIVTYVDYIAQKNGFETPGINVEIKKTMNADASKVVVFDIHLHLNQDFQADQKLVIEKAAQSCPVGNSIDPTIRRTYTFSY